MAKIDTPDPKKSKDKKVQKWWKNPIVFAGVMVLLILAPIFALSIKNHYSLMKLVTSLKEDITSQNEEITSLKGDISSLKKDANLILERCPEGWHFISSRCYFFSENAYNYRKAEKICALMGATIFEPRDQHIMDMVIDFAKTKLGVNFDSPDSQVWIELGWFSVSDRYKLTKVEDSSTHHLICEKSV